MARPSYLSFAASACVFARAEPDAGSRAPDDAVAVHAAHSSLRARTPAEDAAIQESALRLQAYRSLSDSPSSAAPRLIMMMCAGSHD